MRQEGAIFIWKGDKAKYHMGTYTYSTVSKGPFLTAITMQNIKPRLKSPYSDLLYCHFTNCKWMKQELLKDLFDLCTINAIYFEKIKFVCNEMAGENV